MYRDCWALKEEENLSTHSCLRAMSEEEGAREGEGLIEEAEGDVERAGSEIFL